MDGFEEWEPDQKKVANTIRQQLDDFERYLTDKQQLKQETVDKHMRNIGFFAQSFLLPEGITLQDTEDEDIVEFLGNFFIRKSLFGKKSDIPGYLSSFNKWAKHALEAGYISRNTYDEIRYVCKHKAYFYHRFETYFNSEEPEDLMNWDMEGYIEDFHLFVMEQEEKTEDLNTDLRDGEQMVEQDGSEWDESVSTLDNVIPLFGERPHQLIQTTTATNVLDKKNAGHNERVQQLELFGDELESTSATSEQDLMPLINELDWPNPLCERMAGQLVRRLSADHDEAFSRTALIIWYLYATERGPNVRKPGAVEAAIEYVVASALPGYNITQKELAEKYGITQVTISKRAQEIEPYVGALQFFLEESLLAEQLQQNDGRLPPNIPDTAPSRAAQLIDQAWQQSSRKKRIELAEQALDIDPNEADAYVLLAQDKATSARQAVDFYKRGMEAGERALGRTFFEENGGYFWGLIETRPFMRAKQGYAETLSLLEDLDGAIEQYNQLLELNPNDNQGIRYFLMEAYLRQKRYEYVADVIEQDDDDFSVHTIFNQVLVEYGRSIVNG
jgi:tetratricopeptide (TPR) repeat protein